MWNDQYSSHIRDSIAGSWMVGNSRGSEETFPYCLGCKGDVGGGDGTEVWFQTCNVLLI